MNHCDSCGDTTVLVCLDSKCKSKGAPLCQNCECTYVRELSSYQHVIKGSGTPFVRWYMSHWPRHLPPPDSKSRALESRTIEATLEGMLETMSNALSMAWDRGDALMAIAEQATRMHYREYRAISSWNEFVERENGKRERRRLQRWPNTYWTRRLTNKDKGKHDVHYSAGD